MKRGLAISVATAVLATAVLATAVFATEPLAEAVAAPGTSTARAARAETTRFRACFVWPHDEGCTTDIAVAIGWHVKLRATARWHAGKRVQLWQSDPGESGFHRVARLRFDEDGRVTWRWDAPSEVDYCWRWKFRAISGSGELVGVSNRLTAEAAPGD